MANKDQIKQHLSQSATISLDSVPKPPKGNEKKKARVMEHVAKSLKQS